MKVGRDHIASVVNTLFLAYAGASLALLVLFSTSGLPMAEIINSEVFARRSSRPWSVRSGSSPPCRSRRRSQPPSPSAEPDARRAPVTSGGVQPPRSGA
jgi:hypothetical protein